jgi:diadenylate cyclase
LNFPSFQTIVEVVVLAVINYGFIRHLQATRGGGLMVGFIMLALVGVCVFAFLLDAFLLPHIRFIANGALPALIFALLVIFQPELRLLISRIGNIRFVRIVERFVGSREPIETERVVDAIVTTVQRLSKKKIGALIGLQRKDGIAGFAASGTQVNADVSAFLLETIFHHGTPLHDGAVLIAGGRIMWAGCHLPLSETASNSGDLGTRHSAATGLSEQCDALVIVVSEETGRISMAQNGILDRNVSIADVRRQIHGGIVLQLASPQPAKELDDKRTRTTALELLGDDTAVSPVTRAHTHPVEEGSR